MDTINIVLKTKKTFYVDGVKHEMYLGEHEVSNFNYHMLDIIQVSEINDPILVFNRSHKIESIIFNFKSLLIRLDMDNVIFKFAGINISNNIAHGKFYFNKIVNNTISIYSESLDDVFQKFSKNTLYKIQNSSNQYLLNIEKNLYVHDHTMPSDDFSYLVHIYIKEKLGIRFIYKWRLVDYYNVSKYDILDVIELDNIPEDIKNYGK